MTQSDSTIKRWIELPERLANALDAWAESEKRSAKAQAELILEQAIRQHQSEQQRKAA